VPVGKYRLISRTTRRALGRRGLRREDLQQRPAYPNRELFRVRPAVCSRTGEVRGSALHPRSSSSDTREAKEAICVQGMSRYSKSMAFSGELMRRALLASSVPPHTRSSSAAACCRDGREGYQGPLGGGIWERSPQGARALYTARDLLRRYGRYSIVSRAKPQGLPPYGRRM
jgi:hypothetical protein